MTVNKLLELVNTSEFVGQCILSEEFPDRVSQQNTLEIFNFKRDSDMLSKIQLERAAIHHINKII